ncbi:DUF2378 family protein [Vitiosangium sp. GDMCC 1.1324]|uniref:TIGR02265 family protein n=1 Tax=Vitiosangium sp. (strain GDMCC 1.1324) TaxID=2138576 RepID=UPI00130EA19A|nr:DUF2378 family protein [Vitiosangium sp. GDMCC 1.1324]
MTEEAKHEVGQTTAPSEPRLGSEEELRWRKSMLSETAAMRGVLFNAVLEVARTQGGDSAVQRCLEASGEKKFLDFFSYPACKYLDLLYTAARLQSRDLEDFEVAMRRLGQQAAENFLGSTAGRTLLVLVQNNPHRLINSLPWAIQVGVSGVEVSVTRTGPWSGIVTVKRDFSPRPFVEAGILATFEAARVKGVKGRSWPVGPNTNEYEISWQ